MVVGGVLVMLDLDDLDDEAGSHGVLPGPLPGHVIVFGRVSFVDAGNLRNQRIVGVWITQQRAD